MADYNITGTAGAFANTDTTTIGADTDATGVGVVDLQTQTITRLRIENDGFITEFGPLTGSNLAAVIGVIVSAGNPQKTLKIATPQTISADLTIPSNVTLLWDGTGTINQGSHTLTINGPMPGAPLRQLFTGSGPIIFGEGFKDGVSPLWFGA